MSEIQTADIVEAETALTEDVVAVPPYVPTIEETFKASGGHRQFF
ncbi:hypothetical protein [Sinomonas albida]|nr:hypothetical protein [Sinomonas albida]